MFTASVSVEGVDNEGILEGMSGWRVGCRLSFDRAIDRAEAADFLKGVMPPSAQQEQIAGCVCVPLCQLLVSGPAGLLRHFSWAEQVRDL